MSLSKQDFQGTGKIFSFTLRQMIKNKGNLISVIIMVLMAMISVPAMTLFGGGGVLTEERQTTAIYVLDETESDIEWTKLEEYEPYFSGIPVFLAELEADEASLNENEVLLQIRQETAVSGYEVVIVRVSEDTPNNMEVELLLSAANRMLDEIRYEVFGISQEQLDIFYADYSIKTQTLEEYLHPVNEEISENETEVGFDARYALQLMYSVLVMMLSVMSISYIVRAVVEEKASKLVELLMVSVRPLALIVGKILAAMAFVFGMFALIIGGYGLSYFVTGRFLDVSAVGGTLSSLGISSDLFAGLSIPAILGIVISLLTGYMTFSIIAGLFASGCSSTSEMDAATMPPTMIILVGYIASCAASGFEGGPAVIALSLCPVVSVFCAPVQYLIGNINFAVLTVAWILQLVIVVILALFCAKIYNELIIHKGGRVGMKEMLAMAKNTKKEGT